MDEIILESGIPLEVVPATTTTIYNNMTADDPLLVSSHGDVTKKWLEVAYGDYLKFVSNVWLLHNNPGERTLPCFETF